MFSKYELLAAVDELKEANHSIQNCEKLAAIYTVLDHLYPEPSIDFGYSGQGTEPETVIGEYGNTDFLQKIKGKNPGEMWRLMDELMSAVQIFKPSLYDNVMRKI